jgi:hypothetical protein
LLATEHALLDDNADGLGTRLSEAIATAKGSEGAEKPQTRSVLEHAGKPPNDKNVRSVDGALAAIAFLKDFSFPATAPPQLVNEYLSLLDQIERLKLTKSKLPAEAYAAELEKLLIEASRAHREIRRLGGIAD